MDAAAAFAEQEASRLRMEEKKRLKALAAGGAGADSVPATLAPISVPSAPMQGHIEPVLLPQIPMMPQPPYGMPPMIDPAQAHLMYMGQMAFAMRQQQQQLAQSIMAHNPQAPQWQNMSPSPQAPLPSVEQTAANFSALGFGVPPAQPSQQQPQHAQSFSLRPAAKEFVPKSKPTPAPVQQSHQHQHQHQSYGHGSSRNQRHSASPPPPRTEYSPGSPGSPLAAGFDWSKITCPLCHNILNEPACYPCGASACYDCVSKLQVPHPCPTHGGRCPRPFERAPMINDALSALLQACNLVPAEGSPSAPAASSPSPPASREPAYAQQYMNGGGGSGIATRPAPSAYVPDQGVLSSSGMWYPPGSKAPAPQPRPQYQQQYQYQQPHQQFASGGSGYYDDDEENQDEIEAAFDEQDEDLDFNAALAHHSGN